MYQKASSAIDCYIPDYSFEFINGMSEQQLKMLASSFHVFYQAKLATDLELLEIPACFAYHVVPSPFIGFIWFKKVRRGVYKCHMPPSRRNFILPVGRGLSVQPQPPDYTQDFLSIMRAIDTNVVWKTTSTFSKKLQNLYYNLYTMAWYKHMLPIEQNSLRKRVWDFRASYNNKLIWRWEYGACLWGIKPRGGQAMLSRI